MLLIYEDDMLVIVNEIDSCFTRLFPYLYLISFDILCFSHFFHTFGKFFSHPEVVTQGLGLNCLVCCKYLQVSRAAMPNVVPKDWIPCRTRSRTHLVIRFLLYVTRSICE